MRNYITTLLILVAVSMQSQNKEAYRIYDKNGKVSSYSIMVKSSLKSEVVLFGEYHNNSIIHWLQLEFTKDMAEKSNLTLGAEMMEADNQKQLNQYLQNEITFQKLDSTARLWSNVKTDYKPLLDFAKDKNFKFIATNIPRRYASLVYKKDFSALEQLSDGEKQWMALLPIPFEASLPGYKSMMSMQGAHGGDKMAKAQASKDATMAHFILTNLEPDKIFVHYNGTYHSDNFEGINWYLKKKNNSLKIVTIATVEQKDVFKLNNEHLMKADFIIVVDEDVTKTH